jgi:hypothetical protein
VVTRVDAAHADRQIVAPFAMGRSRTSTRLSATPAYGWRPAGRQGTAASETFR